MPETATKPCRKKGHPMKMQGGLELSGLTSLSLALRNGVLAIPYAHLERASRRLLSLSGRIFSRAGSSESRMRMNSSNGSTRKS